MENQTESPEFYRRIKLPFNPKTSTILHIDLNSCFATIEQQANSKLRGKPIAVAAYTSPSGCIIAPSIEAKKLGIKVGLRVKDGKMLYKDLIILPPDPMKYRNVHLRLKKILLTYTNIVIPKSIDEFILDLNGFSALKKDIFQVALEIKQRIKEEIGEWITCSIGIAPNRFLAKLAASLHKPDGLEEINKDNFQEVYSKISLVDLSGIKLKNMARLNNLGIFSVSEFYNSPIWKLKAAFQSILGYYWYLRLHGWEIDDIEFKKHSFGNSFALPKFTSHPQDLLPVLQKLVEKTGFRMRQAGFKARGIHLALVYEDWDFWHKGVSLADYIFDSKDIYKIITKLLLSCPHQKPVRILSESVFNLQKITAKQLSLFEDTQKKENLVQAVDQINQRWGNFVITPARMMGTEKAVIDRIAFGGIKEIEEIVLN